MEAQEGSRKWTGGEPSKNRKRSRRKSAQPFSEAFSKALLDLERNFQVNAVCGYFSFGIACYALLIDVRRANSVDALRSPLHATGGGIFPAGLGLSENFDNFHYCHDLHWFGGRRR